jgi:hypothetical protein
MALFGGAPRDHDLFEGRFALSRLFRKPLRRNILRVETPLRGLREIDFSHQIRGRTVGSKKSCRPIVSHALNAGAGLVTPFYAGFDIDRAHRSMGFPKILDKPRSAPEA